MNLENIASEFAGAHLGDKRRSDRLVRLGVQLARDPGLSFPDAMGSEGQLEALYRFLNNDEVTFEAAQGPHARQTSRRCAGEATALVLHDTTSMKFAGDREGLGSLQSGAQGFFLHTSLAVAPDRTPLGVLRAETWTRRSGYRREGNKRDVRKDPNRESTRWWRAVHACGERLAAPEKVIHVMDREGDNYDLLGRLAEGGHRFVIRLAHNRNLVGSEDKLKSLARRASGVLFREVRVSARTPGLPRDRFIRGPRSARQAKLSVSSVAVELRRSTNFVTGTPAGIAVNVVSAVETDCPPGEEAVEWHLMTSEPIDTPQQLAAVVDAYRARWVIEEFFKALKTGCNFEKRQLESYASLRIALALFLPIAARLLALRHAARTSPEAECTALSPTQVEILRRCSSRPCESGRNEDVYLSLAALGGHLKSNGPPGWLVLGRAYERLLILEQGWKAGRERLRTDR